ncbi:ankyrin repeat domain-containing protein SOWAHB-like [Electrophorus electricus]|uniref:ankyrin repeat domain-containing protein SOWAHB-like n=1 Tax=Electrophorus electricus TaxID=8005 RepID=UPI0015D0BCBD|nr:ankyrin repeat domain-containing protein SOWAHB-like [Electrophorus electricus]
MATDFSQEAVLGFLRTGGGVVRNAHLLAHFKDFLRDNEDRAHNRELFKTFVNALATVKQEDGVCYVVLKKKFRPHVGDVPVSKASSGGRRDQTRQAGRGAAKPAAARPQRHDEVASGARKARHSTEHILPVAGIVNNDDDDDVEIVNLETPVQASWEQTVSSATGSEGGSDACTLKPAPFITDSTRSSGSGQSSDQSGALKALAETTQHNGVYRADLGQLREADGCSQTSFWPPLDCPSYEVVLTSPPGDTAPAHALTDRNHEDPWPFAIPLGQSQSYASSPCLADLPTTASSCCSCVQAGLSQSNDCLFRMTPAVYIQEPGDDDDDDDDDGMAAAALLKAAPQRCNLPLETLRLPPAAGHRGLGQFRGVSSSQGSLNLFPATDPCWPPQFYQDDWSSEDALDVIMAEEVEVEPPASRRLRESELLAQLHRAERSVAPWHRSTGDLPDQEPLPGRAPPSGPVARRLSQRLKSRMCRSLGADLDRAAQEDGDSPRLRRLRRISSFLSDRPASTLSSCAPSTLDGLSSTDSTRSLAHDSACLGPRHSQVPLEPHEHDWFAKAAAGAWADVYSLFREEPGLLAKRDFLSGFNVLHWIAKHGDHRVLNTLWYGVSKTGQQLDVDARSTCGYTPLHLAALHGHRKMLRLLVHKYRADVTLRDNSGKKPWQYLEKNGDRELLELLGAPQRALGSSTGVRRSAEKPPDLAVAPSVATVKRHSSFAALFKHKPQLRVSATAESIL